MKCGRQSETLCSVGPMIVFPDVLVQVLLFCVARAEQIVKQISTCTMTAQGTDDRSTNTYELDSLAGTVGIAIKNQ